MKGRQVLTVCEWMDRTMRTHVVEGPAWEQVEAAIRALDNATRNDVYLVPDEADSETYLCVGGGAGRYVVTGSIRNGEFPVVVDLAKPPSPQAMLVVGGQAGQYPGNWVLDLETTLRAARAFYSSGRFEGDVTWARA
jgi:hypothetical protein